MAVQRFKLALNAARFPLIASRVQRAVSVPQLDGVVRTPRTFMGGDENIDYDLAQIIYGHNFMPTAEGVRSSAYTQAIAATVATNFDAIFPLRDANENTVLYSPSGGSNYVYDDGVSSWRSDSHTDIWGIAPQSTEAVAAAKVTHAYVDGKTFVCYSRLKSAASLAAPGSFTATVGAGGTLAHGTYDYRVTAATPAGESLPTAVQTVTVSGGDRTVTLGWTVVSHAESYLIYSKLGTADERLVGTVSGNTNTFVDTGADLGTVQSPPATAAAFVDMSIMLWNSDFRELEPATYSVINLPFSVGEIDGISSSSGYLLAWSGLTVAWAAFNGTAFDFSPYANGAFTGSGYQIPEDVQGPITALINLAGGFILFTTRNAVGASYHAQALNSPWVFREVPNAGGVESYEQVTVEGSLAKVVAYTSSGIQDISLNSSELSHPEVSDFIAFRATERYDVGLGQLIVGSTRADFFVKMSSIGNRYIALSYGYYPGVYSFALIYDLGLKRWGKMKLVHRDCFYYTQRPGPAPLTYAALQDVSYADMGDTAYQDTEVQQNRASSAPHSIAFLLASGKVALATWSSDDADNEETESVVIIGKVQLSRSSHIQLNCIELDGFRSGTIKVLPSYDGRNLMPAEELIPIEQTGDYLKAGGLIDCKNFAIAVEGRFDLSSVIIEATTSGKV